MMSVIASIKVLFQYTCAVYWHITVSATNNQISNLNNTGYVRIYKTFKENLKYTKMSPS